MTSTISSQVEVVWQEGALATVAGDTCNQSPPHTQVRGVMVIQLHAIWMLSVTFAPICHPICILTNLEKGHLTTAI